MSKEHFDSLPKRYKLRSLISPRRLGLSLERHGRNLVTVCPFHDAGGRKTLFFYDALGYWEFRCLECGVGGDLVDYIALERYSHLGTDRAREAAFAHWMNNLSAGEKALVEESAETPAWLQSGVFERSRVLDTFVQYCAWSLEKNIQAQQFLESKGWTTGQARLYGIGYYGGDLDPFLDFSALNGLDQSLVNFYLDQIEGIREPCLTVPARNSKGQIYTVYGLRLASSAVEYLSFSSVAGDVPFNITPGVSHPIVVPEMFDALTADLAGISGVVSSLRRPLTAGHLYKLKAGGAESLTLVLERDIRSTELDVENVLSLATGLGLVFKSVLLPRGFSVESYIRQRGLRDFEGLLQSTAPDTSRTRRRAVIVQEISENYELNMSRSPGDFYGLTLERFPRLAKHLGGIQPGYYLISSHSFFDKTLFLINFGMDLIRSNPAKMIYVTFEMPRSQVYNRMVAQLAGVSYAEVQSRSENDAQNQRVLESTKELIGMVRANRLEIWDDNQVTDDKTLLRMIREEVQENRNVFVCVDGFYRISTKTHTDIPDIDERRSAVMLDIYKTLGIPVFCTGEMELSKWVAESGRAPQLMDILTPQAYVRDPGYVLFLSNTPEGELELHLLKNRMGGTPLHVPLEMDVSGSSLREK